MLGTGRCSKHPFFPFTPSHPAIRGWDNYTCGLMVSPEPGSPKTAPAVSISMDSQVHWEKMFPALCSGPPHGCKDAIEPAPEPLSLYLGVPAMTQVSSGPQSPILARERLIQPAPPSSAARTDPGEKPAH